jgi:hypothetical protein
MPQRRRLNAEEKKTQAKLNKERAYAFYDAGSRARAKPKAKPKAKAASGSEAFRKKYTPGGIQNLVDVMSKKKGK